jgi:hypothetical protein
MDDVSFSQMKEQMRFLNINSNTALKATMVQEYIKQEQIRQRHYEARAKGNEAVKDDKEGLLGALRRTLRFSSDEEEPRPGQESTTRQEEPLMMRGGSCVLIDDILQQGGRRPSLSFGRFVEPSLALGGLVGGGSAKNRQEAPQRLLYSSSNKRRTQERRHSLQGLDFVAMLDSKVQEQSERRPSDMVNDDQPVTDLASYLMQFVDADDDEASSGCKEEDRSLETNLFMVSRRSSPDGKPGGPKRKGAQQLSFQKSPVNCCVIPTEANLTGIGQHTSLKHLNPPISNPHRRSSFPAESLARGKPVSSVTLTRSQQKRPSITNSILEVLLTLGRPDICILGGSGGSLSADEYEQKLANMNLVRQEEHIGPDYIPEQSASCCQQIPAEISVVKAAVPSRQWVVRRQSSSSTRRSSCSPVRELRGDEETDNYDTSNGKQREWSASQESSALSFRSTYKQGELLVDFPSAISKGDNYYDGADDDEEAFVDFPSTPRSMSFTSSDGTSDVSPNRRVGHSKTSKSHESRVRNQPWAKVRLTMDPPVLQEKDHDLANECRANGKHAHAKMSDFTGNQNEANKEPGESVQTKPSHRNDDKGDCSKVYTEYDPSMEFEKPSNWVDDEEESDEESVEQLDVLSKSTNWVDGRCNVHKKVERQHAAPFASRDQELFKTFGIIDREAALAKWALSNSSQQPQHSQSTTNKPLAEGAFDEADLRGVLVDDE